MLSIIIPAYNEEQLLAETLRRIRAATGEAFDYELIVVDNSSTDRTAEIARVDGAHVADEPVRQIARARNRGAEVAGGEWLLFIDADSYPSTELMSEVRELILSSTCVGCGTTVRVEGGSMLNKLRMERLNPLFRLFGFSGGAFLLARAEAFRAIGGFSTKLFAFEEIELVVRLRRRGGLHGQRFRVLHQHPVTTSGRKWDHGIREFPRLFVSNLAAVLFLLPHLLLPRRWAPTPPRWLFGYWYGR